MSPSEPTRTRSNTVATSTSTGRKNSDSATGDAAPAPKTPKLRSACDSCHRSKVRCSGGQPCTRCKEFGSNCAYSSSARTGKPKGSRSRKTIEREQRVAAMAMLEREGTTDADKKATPSVWNVSPTTDIACTLNSGTEGITIPTNTMEPDNTWAFPMSSLISDGARSIEMDDGGDKMAGLTSDMSWFMDDNLHSLTIDHNHHDMAFGGIFWDSNHMWTTTSLDTDQHMPALSAGSVNSLLEPHSPITSDSGTDSLALHASGTKCKCLTEIASLVAPFASLISVVSAERTDLFLSLVRKMCTACDTYCECQHCSKNAAGVSLATTILRLVTWLVGRLGVWQNDESGNDLKLQLGTYRVSDGDEQQTLVRELVRCGLRKLLNASRCMRDVVARRPVRDVGEVQPTPSAFDTGEEAALGAELVCFDHTLSQLQACFDGMMDGTERRDEMR